MKCYRCDQTSPLFRVNEKGVPGIWACTTHRLKVDPEVDAIVSVIAGSQPEDHDITAPSASQESGR